MPKPVANTQIGSLTDHQRGTNDTLSGVDRVPIVGDAFAMYDKARGGNDTLIGVADQFNILAGDATDMYGESRGGNDTLIGAAGGQGNVLIGDAVGDMRDDSRGGNDTIIGADAGFNTIYGDALFMYDNSRGGNDTLIGAVDSNISGDASDMSDNAQGGDDLLIARGEFNFLMGDAAGLMTGFARGGNDTLVGDDLSASVLTGDAFSIRSESRGGNDTLVCGDASGNIVRGDAHNMEGNARGGNDTLISGHGTDSMWGDAEFINRLPASPDAPTGGVMTGADTFVFAPDNGNDFVYDFRQSDGDRIDVSAYGFNSLVDMMITFDNGNTRIGFDANDSVTLVGFGDPTALRPSDFVLA